MPRVVSCPTCGHSGRVPDNLPGGRIKCPKCGFVSPLPRPEQAPSPAVEEILEVLPAQSAESAVSEEVLEALPADTPATAGRPDRLASCHLLRPRSFWIRAKSTSPAALDYNIFDPNEDGLVGYVVDSSDGTGGVLEVFSQKGSYASTAVVYDAATDKPIVVIHREAFRKVLGVKPSRVDICDHADRLLGWFEVKPIPAKGVFPIYDARDRAIAELEGKWFPQPEYVYFGSDGKKLGRLEAEGDVRRFFTSVLSWTKRGGVLSLALASTIADGPKIKALLLATTLTLEQFGASVRLPHMH